MHWRGSENTHNLEKLCICINQRLLGLLADGRAISSLFFFGNEASWEIRHCLASVVCWMVGLLSSN
jgi:hypothetical protein